MRIIALITEGVASPWLAQRSKLFGRVYNAAAWRFESVKFRGQIAVGCSDERSDTSLNLPVPGRDQCGESPVFSLSNPAGLGLPPEFYALRTVVRRQSAANRSKAETGMPLCRSESMPSWRTNRRRSIKARILRAAGAWGRLSQPRHPTGRRLWFLIEQSIKGFALCVCQSVGQGAVDYAFGSALRLMRQ
jgi:hypothetical protein